MKLALDSTVTLLSGNKMPILGLGTWNLDFRTAETIMTALHLGYPMIDTSGDYGTQPGIGEGIKLSSMRRNSFYLVTKVEETDDAYKATEKNLHELGLKAADLMLIHRPPKNGAGEELWRRLIKAREDGLTRDIGVSNYSTEQIDALIEATDVTPVVNQIEWTPFGYNHEMLEYCNQRGIIIQAYSPLTHNKRIDDQRLTEIGLRYDKTPAQILLRWCLQMGTVPIAKANQTMHLEQNLEIFDFEISEQDMDELNSFNEHYSALGKQPVYEEQG